MFDSLVKTGVTKPFPTAVTKLKALYAQVAACLNRKAVLKTPRVPRSLPNFLARYFSRSSGGSFRMVSEMMVAISAYIPVHRNLQMGYNRKLFMRHSEATHHIFLVFLNILIRSPPCGGTERKQLADGATALSASRH